MHPLGTGARGLASIGVVSLAGLQVGGWCLANNCRENGKLCGKRGDAVRYTMIVNS